MNPIQLTHLSKAFADFAIRDLSLTVPEGTICGLVGENGAGKTTLIRLLTGALTPDSGTVSLLGAENTEPDFAAVRQDLGVVLDDAYFPEMLSAAQIGHVMADTYHRWDDALFGDYLRRFDLPVKKAVKDFSRGMRMKLAIAAALSHHPRLLVLDEATAGLDPIVRDEVLELFYDFTRQETHSILISSHILSDLEKLCDHVAFLHQGQLLFCEEKDRLLEDLALFTAPAAQIHDLPPEAVLGKRELAYGAVRALVRRSQVSDGLTLEKPTMEDVILLLVKGGKTL